MTATHLRFEFDSLGRVALAGTYTGGDLDANEHRLYRPQLPPGTRGVIVPRSSPVHAERYARALIEENGGFGS